MVGRAVAFATQVAMTTSLRSRCCGRGFHYCRPSKWRTVLGDRKIYRPSNLASRDRRGRRSRNPESLWPAVSTNNWDRYIPPGTIHEMRRTQTLDLLRELCRPLQRIVPIAARAAYVRTSANIRFSHFFLETRTQSKNLLNLLLFRSGKASHSQSGRPDRSAFVWVSPHTLPSETCLRDVDAGSRRLKHQPI